LADLRARKGIAYIWISHDLGVVRYSTDHLIVMREGRVVEAGATRETLDSPSHPYTRALRSSVPRPGWTPRRRPAELANGHR
jgi:ABC-type glutathione transport system ATPase component